MLFWTRHANLRRVENYIYDPSARIIKNPLNSTVFWKRHLNLATRSLNSATRQKCNYDPNGLPYNSMSLYIGVDSKVQSLHHANLHCKHEHTILLRQ